MYIQVNRPPHPSQFPFTLSIHPTAQTPLSHLRLHRAFMLKNQMAMSKHEEVRARPRHPLALTLCISSTPHARARMWCRNGRLICPRFGEACHARSETRSILEGVENDVFPQMSCLERCILYIQRRERNVRARQATVSSMCLAVFFLLLSFEFSHENTTYVSQRHFEHAPRYLSRISPRFSNTSVQSYTT